ncbi:MAG: efflux RND transporter periplasmic adaptor subunit [Pirellulales bacterium]|nr:efflux RND transporter periplasmic adaptor subunit [Pirellulales bacterium]
MKLLLKLLIAVLILGSIGAGLYYPAHSYWVEHNKPEWMLAEVEKGDIIAEVNSTGEIKPVKSVQIGSFVSGPITEINVDFNDRVKEKDILAKIDPKLFEANVRRDEALLATRRAEVERVKALLKQAENDERRARTLQQENPDYISGTEMDQYIYATLSLKAQLTVAEASVDQAIANLENSSANLEYTVIASPVDGIVIDRKIDMGQTLASQFQTPEMFVVAVDMDKKMHVFASVDEADMGMIMKAKEEGQRVEFTVDAWRGEVFTGQIEQIRVSSTITQNVVTYPVVVVTPNPDMKLLPGMTAEISFRVDERHDVIKIPNAALRFFPDAKYVRNEDKKLLEGEEVPTTEDEDDNATEQVLSAAERADAERREKQKHVWIVEGNSLKAVKVVVGLSDNKFSEMVSGDLKPGQKLVTRLKTK